MGEANRHFKNTETISYDETYQAFKNWSGLSPFSSEWSKAIKDFEQYLGRSVLNKTHSKLWKVPPHVARKVRSLNSPHWKTLMKVRRLRKQKCKK